MKPNFLFIISETSESSFTGKLYLITFNFGMYLEVKQTLKCEKNLKVCR